MQRATPPPAPASIQTPPRARPVATPLTSKPSLHSFGTQDSLAEQIFKAECEAVGKHAFVQQPMPGSLDDAAPSPLVPSAALLPPLAWAVQPPAPAVQPLAPAVQPPAPAVQPLALAVQPTAPAVRPSAPAIQAAAPLRAERGQELDDDTENNNMSEGAKRERKIYNRFYHGLCRSPKAPPEVVQLYNKSKGKRGGLLFIFEDWMQSGAPKPGDDWKQMSMVIKLTRKNSQRTKGTYVLMSRDALVAKYKDAPWTSNGVETCVCVEHVRHFFLAEHCVHASF